MLKIKPVTKTVILKRYDWFINHFSQPEKPRKVTLISKSSIFFS